MSAINLTALLGVVGAIAVADINRTDLMEITGLSKPTIARLLRDARAHLQMEIEYIRDDQGGFYRITNWGLLSRSKLITHFNIAQEDKPC